MNPPKPKGIDFNENEIRTALKENYPLMLMLDFSQICNLNCKYCFSGADMHKRIDGELEYKNYVDIINQAKDMGIKTIFVPGAGEPSLDENFWNVLPLVHKAGITLIVFTSGYTLTKENIKKLYENGATIGIKINSFKPEVQDWLAGIEGYTKKRDRTLNLLIKQGFNSAKPTRLWLDTLVCKQNFDEIVDLFVYSRENNIWPGINTMLHMGSGSEEKIMKQLDVPVKKIKELWSKISTVDKEKYGYEWVPRPPYAAWDCNLYYFTMRIDNKGNVFKCLGAPIIGNILDKNKKVKKDILRYFWNSRSMNMLTCVDKNIDQLIDGTYYGCPCRRNLKYGEKSMFQLKPEEDIWKSNI